MGRDNATHPKHLPRDGWRQEEVCRKLSHLFDRHILPLLIDVNLSGNLQSLLYTGFLYLHDGIPFWITAAHVCEAISKILANGQARITTMKWLDASSDCGLPIAREQLTLLPIDPASIDIGICPLKPYYAKLILAGGNKTFLDSRGVKPEAA